MDKVPNSTAGHDTPELEIYGMEGVPKGDLERHQQGLPLVPHKRPKFLESGGLLPLLAAQKASSGAISITGQSTFFDDASVGVIANATPYVISSGTHSILYSKFFHVRSSTSISSAVLQRLLWCSVSSTINQ